MFRFAASEMLSALGLVPMMVLVLWWARVRTRRDLARFGDRPLLARLTASISPRGRAAKAVLLVVTVTLTVTALARPQFGSRVETVRREGQDIIVALDLSASMAAEDIAPNRLDRAKFAIADLNRPIGRRPGGAGGLCRRGVRAKPSDARLRCRHALPERDGHRHDLCAGHQPRTGDSTSHWTHSQRPTGITACWSSSPTAKTTKDEVEAALDRAVEEEVQIYAVGIGSTEGVPIPDVDADGQTQGFKRDADGSVVTTRLDEATLQRLASRTDGAYYHASPGGTELAVLAEELSAADGQQFDVEQVTIFDEQYQLFLGLALLLLVVEALVPERRRVDVAWTGRFK